MSKNTSSTAYYKNALGTKKGNLLKLIECVPNISEGRNDEVINDIVQATKSEHVEILHVDRGRAANRTVITFAGTPQDVSNAAFMLIKRTAELVDMRKHTGEHPRIGATDVCPFIPIQNTSMADCVAIARAVGKQVGEELHIPVYLYGEAAYSKERKNLSYLRNGEYEGITEKLKDPKLLPDFGPPIFNERSGITIIGARSFLIAYNINLKTHDKKLAQEIAGIIRESGIKKRDKEGELIIVPGLFPHCAALGWFIEDYGIAQVSTNLSNFELSPMHEVFDCVCQLAKERGISVSGSEIVGLLPKKALLDAGLYYLRKKGSLTKASEEDIISTAIESLGLNDLYPFKIEEKLIEERLSSLFNSKKDL
ncbi:MAG: glutamate formimidoyltransferase [SAR324 cluster bacterium]|uniref:glutamate formimidoyltransferase n=1 Tax=SAR324 cluster bacterium TaxID=2024889 RepID=A0A7X9ILC3_9DELT|nr:glutamate formimidoyltransferase [SAR324 cluster bacterium]